MATQRNREHTDESGDIMPAAEPIDTDRIRAAVREIIIGVGEDLGVHIGDAARFSAQPYVARSSCPGATLRRM